jgi:hypothetical protein
MSKVKRNITQTKILSWNILKSAKRVSERAVLSLKLCQSNHFFFFYKNLPFQTKEKNRDRLNFELSYIGVQIDLPELIVSSSKKSVEISKFVCQHQWRHPKEEDADLTLSGE